MRKHISQGRPQSVKVGSTRTASIKSRIQGLSCKYVKEISSNSRSHWQTSMDLLSGLTGSLPLSKRLLVSHRSIMTKTGQRGYSSSIALRRFTVI